MGVFPEYLNPINRPDCCNVICAVTTGVNAPSGRSEQRYGQQKPIDTTLVRRESTSGLCLLVRQPRRRRAEADDRAQSAGARSVTCDERQPPKHKTLLKCGKGCAAASSSRPFPTPRPRPGGMDNTMTAIIVGGGSLMPTNDQYAPRTD
jgi:hypothetical protein